jgi:F-box/leucine-rich repeat protein 2/20
MEYVGAGCPNLNHLDIAECYQLTNKGVEYVCSGCEKLKYLGIQKCPEMTDDVMENIFKSKKLEVLVLSCNSQLSGIHFLLIPSNLVHLTKLHIHDCFSLDEKCIGKLREEMPHLLILDHTNNEETDVNLGDATFFISQLL